MDNTSFEVLGYESETHFNHRISNQIVEYVSKRIAYEIGLDATNRFEIVKIQSMDRETIYIIKRYL